MIIKLDIEYTSLGHLPLGLGFAQEDGLLFIISLFIKMESTVNKLQLALFLAATILATPMHKAPHRKQAAWKIVPISSDETC